MTPLLSVSDPVLRDILRFISFSVRACLTFPIHVVVCLPLLMFPSTSQWFRRRVPTTCVVCVKTTRFKSGDRRAFNIPIPPVVSAGALGRVYQIPRVVPLNL